MARRRNNWARNVFLPPLAVGILVAVTAFLLPRFLPPNDQELSYMADSPLAINRLDIQINDIGVTQLVLYRVRLWNSGEETLRELPIRFVFTETAGFEIFHTGHLTNPPEEFGKIETDEADPFSRRFVYEYLNPGNEDEVTFLTNRETHLRVAANPEGVTVKEVGGTTPSPSIGGMFGFAGIVASLGALLSGLLGFLALRWAPKRRGED